MTLGQCLCGAVRVEVEHLADTMSACHCSNCQRWTGSVFMGLDGRGVRATGPVKTYAATGFSERAWCDRCGSALWIHDTGSQVYDLMPGLFDNFANAKLVREVYADKCPSGFALAGEIDRVTKANYEAGNLHDQGDMP